MTNTPVSIILLFFHNKFKGICLKINIYKQVSCYSLLCFFTPVHTGSPGFSWGMSERLILVGVTGCGLLFLQKSSVYFDTVLVHTVHGILRPTVLRRLVPVIV